MSLVPKLLNIEVLFPMANGRVLGALGPSLAKIQIPMDFRYVSAGVGSS